ncbi:MAG: hypothetical protein AAGA58_07345 [Verrucomicrobiota bacterium]
MTRFQAPALLLALMLVSCSNKVYYIDYEAYPVLPISGTSKKLRAMSKVKPGLKEKLFYGNYGGPGNNGGRPIDALDALFYEHDKAYVEGYRLRKLRESDRALVEGLEALDADGLSPKALAFREASINFFSRRISGWIGKPRDVKWGLRRKQQAFPISEYPGANRE